ncbi:MAG: hypothetical protein ACXWJK_15125 [Burkholderiaceae bacterium]
MIHHKKVANKFETYAHAFLFRIIWCVAAQHTDDQCDNEDALTGCKIEYPFGEMPIVE